MPVSFSIKPKDEPPNSLPVKAALPLEPSSDEEEQERSDTKSTIPNLSLASILPLRPPTTLAGTNDANRNGQSHSTKTRKNSLAADVEQSDSFIRDTMLEQDNANDEKKEAKRAEDKVKNRLAQLAREKLGILSKEKQLQLERKKRAIAFLTQMTGTCSTIGGICIDSLNLILIYAVLGAPLTTSEGSTDDKAGNDVPASSAAAVATGSADSDSSDSVTFITASPGGMLKRQRNFRNTKIDTNDRADDDDDDVVEVITKSSPFRSRSHSRTRFVHQSNHFTNSISK